VSGAVDGGALWSVFVETSFGRLWIMRLALATLVLFLLTGTHENRLAPLLSALLLLSLAGVGHTRVSDGASHLVHLLADATHLAAAGAWLGGLLPLGYLLAGVRPSAIREDSRNARIALQRFSGMGSVAVALLVGSGLIKSWFLVGSLSALTRTPYGQLLLGKLGLFLSMLVLAALNRFWLVPALARDLSSERPYPDVRRLRYHVLGEQALGLCIVLIVGILGTFHPAIGMPS
jgi:putative copper resistance protein D